MRKKNKKISHLIEAAFIHALLFVFRRMSFRVASAVGGFLGRSCGRLLAVNRTAKRNLRKVMPELSDDEIDHITKYMWDNLTRTICEFAHLGSMSQEEFSKHVKLNNYHIAEELLASDKCCIFVSGHMANWELLPKLAALHSIPLALVYRQANNPYVEKIICDIRQSYQSINIQKGAAGARHLIKTVTKKQPVGMLVDQKQNDGIDVPFFGINAKTASAVANVSLKYDCHIIPVQMVRKHKHNSEITIHPPLEYQKTGDTDKDVLDIMSRINNFLEKCIRENPEQWFWVHNRWPKT